MMRMGIDIMAEQCDTAQVQCQEHHRYIVVHLVCPQTGLVWIIFIHTLQ